MLGRRFNFIVPCTYVRNGLEWRRYRRREEHGYRRRRRIIINAYKERIMFDPKPQNLFKHNVEIRNRFSRSSYFNKWY